MLRRANIIIILFFLLAIGAVAQEEQSAEQAFEEELEAYRAAETPQAKLDVLRDYLTRFPETRYTVSLVNWAVRHLVDELDNAEGALELADTILAEVDHAEIIFEVRKLKVGLLGRLGRAEELVALVAELSEGRELDFNQLRSFAEAALDVELWDLAIGQCDAALRLATPEAYRANYPNQDLSDEQALQSARNRVGLAQTIRGWALANIARTDEAMAAFDEAGENIRLFYPGFPSNELYLYCGRVLMREGNYGGAIEKLAPGAVLGGREDELEALQEAYAALNGSGDGFDEFVSEIRLRLAKPVDDFTLPDYSGGELTLSSLRGNVVLLNFWFPT